MVTSAGSTDESSFLEKRQWAASLGLSTARNEWKLSLEPACHTQLLSHVTLNSFPLREVSRRRLLRQ